MNVYWSPSADKRWKCQSINFYYFFFCLSYYSREIDFHNVKEKKLHAISEDMKSKKFLKKSVAKKSPKSFLPAEKKKKNAHPVRVEIVRVSTGEVHLPRHAHVAEGGAEPLIDGGGDALQLGQPLRLEGVAGGPIRGAIFVLFFVWFFVGFFIYFCGNLERQGNCW